ncbi:TolC family protein [Pseudomonas yamanorum]|nr:TolC family protein [Pseudomonas yamanorum]
MNPIKPRYFPLTPAAWLVSVCLAGGLSLQSASADELGAFTRVLPANNVAAKASPTFSLQPRAHVPSRAAPAAATVKPDDSWLVSFSADRTAPATPVVQAASAPVTAVQVTDRSTDSPILTFNSVPSAPVASAPAPVEIKQAPARPSATAAGAVRNKEALLSFSPTSAAVAAVETVPVRPEAAPAPRPLATSAAAEPPAQGAAARPVTQQTHSVSAVAFAALPPRMAARRGVGNPVLGPSESELRGVFNRAVETAIGRAPTIFRARAEQEAALADIDEAKGQRWPQVDVGTTSSPIRYGKGSEEDGGSGGINVAVTTPIYDWGRIRNSIDSRERLSVAADESLEAEKETTGYEVVSTLVELGKQRIIVDLSQQFADRMDDLVKMLAGIVAVDKGRYSELTQAKARLLQAQALRDAADARARDAEITLHKLVGDRPIPIPRAKEWNIRLANLEQLLDDAKTHPTILQATAEAESAELQAKAVRAGGLPQLNWVISKSTAEDAIGREQPWQTNLAMTWGAFRGGSTRAAERAALQRAGASRYQTDQQRRDLEFRIRTADNDARTQLERAELYRDLAVESGQIREDFFLQWHHLGKRTLLDVLSAENEHYGNLVSEITNRFDGYQAILRQYASAGTLASWLRGGK